MNGKQMIALVGSGLLLAASWSYAQEQQDQAVPPQQVADGGVEAVRDAQEGAPVPVEKFEGAGKVLRKQAKSRKWREGWDDKKKRIIVIEEAEFKTKDPATDESFFIKREMAAKKAVLKAKVSIIQTINQDAMRRQGMAGTWIQCRFQNQFRFVLIQMHMAVDLINQGMQADITIDQTNQNVFASFDIEVAAIISQID